MINHFQAPFFVSPSSALQVIKGTGGGGIGYRPGNEKSCLAGNLMPQRVCKREERINITGVTMFSAKDSV